MLLDWEKAFDKINKTKMIEALTRLNAPTKKKNNIAALYEDFKFKVKCK